jgi:signal transduction histidine kinase
MSSSAQNLVATWELEARTGALTADARCRNLHGLPIEGKISLNALLCAIDREHQPRVAQAIQTTLEAPGPAGFEVEYPVTVDGHTRWLFALGQVTKTERGARAAVAVLDISGRHRQEEAAKQQADLYQELVGIVSHDLKNPVQVMIAGLALLEAGGLDATQANVARRLKNATDRAGRLITDLLDFSRVRLGGGIPVSKRSTDLAELVKDVIASFAIARPDRRIELTVEGDTRCPIDSDRMQQVVTNLLDHAFDRAKDQEPIRVWAIGRARTVELAVVTHGEPITGELLPKVFEPLSPEAQRRNRLRVGLGMYIARSIAEAHEGTVEATSSEEETRFCVLLPRGS